MYKYILALAFGSVLVSAQAKSEAIHSQSQCDNHRAEFELVTDKFSHQENRWVLTDQQGTLIASGARYAGNQKHKEPLCLDEGQYKLTVLDSYGDGISTGGYRLTLNQKTLAEGADFGYRDTHTFTIGLREEAMARPSE